MLIEIILSYRAITLYATNITAFSSRNFPNWKVTNLLVYTKKTGPHYEGPVSFWFIFF